MSSEIGCISRIGSDDGVSPRHLAVCGRTSKTAYGLAISLVTLSYPSPRDFLLPQPTVVATGHLATVQAEQTLYSTVFGTYSSSPNNSSFLDAMLTLLDLPDELLQAIIRQCTKKDQINIGLVEPQLWANARIVDETLCLYPNERIISAALWLLSPSPHLPPTVAVSIKNLWLSWTDGQAGLDLTSMVERARRKDWTDHRRRPLDLYGGLTILFKECSNLVRLTVEGPVSRPLSKSLPPWLQNYLPAMRREDNKGEEQAAALLPQITRAAEEGSAKIVELFLIRVQVDKLVAEPDWQSRMEASCIWLRKLSVQSFQPGRASAQFLNKLPSFPSIQTVHISGPSGLNISLLFPYPGHGEAARGLTQLSSNHSHTPDGRAPRFCRQIFPRLKSRSRGK